MLPRVLRDASQASEKMSKLQDPCLNCTTPLQSSACESNSQAKGMMQARCLDRTDYGGAAVRVRSRNAANRRNWRILNVACLLNTPESRRYWRSLNMFKRSIATRTLPISPPRCKSWSGKTCFIQIMKRHPSHKDLQVDGRGDLAKLAEDHVRTRPGSVHGRTWL
jgi:hypothetical protein